MSPPGLCCPAGLLLAAFVGLGGACTAPAQEPFPSQSIEIVVPFGPGGGAHRLGTVLAREMEQHLRAPLHVSTVAGGSGNVGLTRLLTNPPDGYTAAILTATTVASWAAGVGFARLPDFTVLAMVEESPSMIMVPAASPFGSFRDLLEHARVHPGRLRVATAGQASLGELVLTGLARQGYRMLAVPFAKPEERYASLARRRADAVFEQPADVSGFLKSRQWRALVVFADRRHSAFPEVPTAAEFDIAIDLSNFRALVIRAGTPPERVNMLVQAIERAVSSPQWRRYCEEAVTCTSVRTPEQATLRIQRFYQSVRKHLKPGVDT